MIRTLFKVERGTIVHFLKWGAALLAFILALWIGLSVFGRPGAAATLGGPIAKGSIYGAQEADVGLPLAGDALSARRAGGEVVVTAPGRHAGSETLRSDCLAACDQQG